MKTGSYFRLLRNYTRAIRYPFPGTPVKGLQVLGFLETRSIKFDTVYFLDVNEGIVPHTKKEDTLLPYKMRKFLKLPTHEDSEKISKYYFNTLLGGAKQVHIFSPFPRLLSHYQENRRARSRHRLARYGQ